MMFSFSAAGKIDQDILEVIAVLVRVFRWDSSSEGGDLASVTTHGCWRKFSGE